MPRLDLRLNELSLRELKEIAVQAGIQTEGMKKRDEFVTKLTSLENIGDVVKAWEVSLSHLLDSKSLKELKDIAARHGVSISKDDHRKELINTLIANPSAAAIAESLKSEKSLDTIKAQLEEVKGEIVRTAEAVRLPPMEDPTVDPALKEALSLEVDFDHCEDLLDQARMRFEEKNFEGALSAAVEARESAEKCSMEMENSTLAYAILSAQRLVEECGKAGRDVEKAADILRTAKRLFREGDTDGMNGQLKELEAVSRSLFSAEVRRARDEIHRTQEIMRDISNLGADVRKAEDVLGEARDALKRNEYKRSIEHSARAIEMAETAKQERLKSIEEAIPSTTSIIEEAKHVGADIAEAERLVSKAKTAFASKEYLLASELVKRAERAAMESQQNQILRAMELRRRQVEKAQAIVTQIEPVIDEAEGFGMDIAEARTLLQQAKDILIEGDYVNGTIFAKNAAEVSRRLEPMLVEERAKRGIAKPIEGVCASCGSGRLQFTDDGWSRCLDCGHTYRWRAPTGVWSKFKNLWKD
jgi:hypothetical protein